MNDCHRELIAIIEHGDAARKFSTLRRLGIGGDGLKACGGLIGLTNVEIDHDLKRFQPFRCGVLALILPVALPNDEIIDLAAVIVREPGETYLRLGHAAILGMSNVEKAEFFSTPLTVHKTPIHWLQTNGEGCCVIDWRAPLALYLAGITRILVQDVAFGRRLERVLRQDVKLPDIRIIDDEIPDAA